MLASIDNLKEYLGAEGNDKDDVLLTRLMNSATAAIESYCGRTFASATYTEYQDGTGRNVLNLAQFPIISITSITEGGGGTLTSGDDPYASPTPDVITYKEQGQLIRPWIVWLPYHRYYKIVYVAGYATIPADLVQACVELGALMLRGKEHTGISQKTSATQSTNYIDKLSEFSRNTLDGYADVILGRAN
jgi:hypothetical protein